MLIVRKKESDRNIIRVLLFFILTAFLFVAEYWAKELLAGQPQISNQNIIYGRINLPYGCAFTFGLAILLKLSRVWRASLCHRGYQLTTFLSLVFTGVVINLMDYLKTGGITDYLVVGYLNFNLADIYIVAGLSLLTVGVHRSSS